MYERRCVSLQGVGIVADTSLDRTLSTLLESTAVTTQK
jgi:hypothetical protein